MKKNFLKKVTENKAITAVTNYCKAHKSTLIAGGTIGSSLATTAIVFRNSPRIHEIIFDARAALESANNDEEKKSIYKATIKELTPLIVPILLFQTSNIVLTIIAKNDSDKKDRQIAEITSAVAAASQVIDQYEVFKKEAESELGEKKLNKVLNKVTESRGNIIVCDNLDLGPGDIIFRDVYSGHVFKGSKDTVRLACERMSNEAKRDDTGCVILGGTYNETLNIPDSILSNKFGYFADGSDFEVTPYFAPTEAEINGSTVPAYEVWLRPEPSYIDD